MNVYTYLLLLAQISDALNSTMYRNNVFTAISFCLQVLKVYTVIILNNFLKQKNSEKVLYVYRH